MCLVSDLLCDSVSCLNVENNSCSVLQSQIIEFQWADIRQWEADDEGMSFNFEYVRTGKKPRWVKVFTSYVS